MVNGAAGSVGSAVVQRLVRDGHRVIGTASAANHELLRALRATPVGYGPTMVDELSAAAPDGIDAGVDTAGHNFIARVAPVLPAGRIVTITDFAAAEAGAIASAGDPAALVAGPIGPVLGLAAAGDLTVRIDSVLPFEEAEQVLARSEAGHPAGKIVLSGPAD